MDEEDAVQPHDGVSSASTQKGVPQDETGQMKVEDVVLSEMSQTQKDRPCTTRLIGHDLQVVGFMKSKSEMAVNRAGEWATGGD